MGRSRGTRVKVPDMASITPDPASGIFRIEFRYGGRQFQRSLKMADENEAEATRGCVEETLILLRRGRLQLPPGADPGTFILSDGRLTGKPVLEAPPEALTLAQLFDLYRRSLPEGAKERNTLRTEGIHQAHALRLLGAATPATSLTLRDVQAYADRRARERSAAAPPGRTRSARS